MDPISWCSLLLPFHKSDLFRQDFHFKIMNIEERSRSGSISKTKKPGPRPTACIWCQSTDCQHCRCTGQMGCSHKKGEMCPNPRYKRRLVCNSCEKNKLREKQQSNVLQVVKKKREKPSTKSNPKRDIAKSTVLKGNSKLNMSMTSVPNDLSERIEMMCA